MAFIESLMNQSDTTKTPGDESLIGPILALDLGQKRVGVAVSDAMLISITKHPPIARSNWKQLLRDVSNLINRLDAKTLVIGLPLSLDGARGSAAQEAEYAAGKFARSLNLPVYLQDERLTSVEAEEQLRSFGKSPLEIDFLIDCQAAAIILMDFLSAEQPRIPVAVP